MTHTVPLTSAQDQNTLTKHSENKYSDLSFFTFNKEVSVGK